MKYRYQTRTNGVTAKSLDKLHHLGKLGTIKEVRGYRYETKPGWTSCDMVMVTGEKGTARFGGFSWGFSGTGPRGLVDLLTTIGLSEHLARHIAFCGYCTSKVQTDWILTLEGGNKITFWENV